MDNPEECSICCISYDERERRPRTLPCGHTFCSPCIGDLIEDGQLSCPSCRSHYTATSATQFPVSYGIEAFIKRLKAIELTQIKTLPSAPPLQYATQARTLLEELRQKETLPSAPPLPDITGAVVVTPFQEVAKGMSRRLWSLVEEQKSSVSSVVASSQEVQSQLDQYRAQLADWKTQHLQLLDRLYVLVEQNKATLELLEQEDTRVLGMKKEGEKGEKQLEAVHWCLHTVNTAQEVGPAINQADHYSVETENWMQKCQETFPDINTVTTSMKVRESTLTALDTLTGDGEAEVHFLLKDPASLIMEKVKYITHHMNVEYLCRMSAPVRKLMEAGQVCGVQEDQGGLRSSRITLEDGQLYLHCLLDQPPPLHARTLPVSEVVGTLDPSSTLVFLDLSWRGSTRGRVQIRLSPDTSLARQFVLLCTGQNGHSYLNTELLQVWYRDKPGECVVSGDYKQHSTGSATLMPLPQTKYRKSGEAGAVRSGWGSGTGADLSGQFIITTRNCMEGREYSGIFGEVESGMEVVRAAVRFSDIKQVIVVDCGVVLPL